MNVKLISAVVVASLCGGLSAAAPWRHGERVSLWPEDRIPDFQEHQIAEMTDEAWKPGGKWAEPDPAFEPAKHRMPYLEWFEKPAKPNGACMILVPGGSYECCCDVTLVKLWKETFTRLGYQTAGLVYRTPRAKNAPYYRSGWQDGQRAVRIARSQAKERGYNPERIGVIGMSAGGHLVTMLATSALTPAYARVDDLDDVPCHVNCCIANAPAYNTATTGGGTRPQDGTLVFDLKANPCFKFDERTCPISFHHGGTDSYTPNGSTQCYRELRKRKVPAELHLYADKGHGAHGLERAIEFLHQMNFDGSLGAEVERRVFTGAFTDRQDKELLWPEGRMPSRLTCQTNAPYLTWFVPKTLRTKAIQVITPGGAYVGCNDSGEGLPVAEYFNKMGMAAVVVKYRCPRPKGLEKHWTAWQDAQRAIRKVRHAAPVRGLDPDRIGVMGFSAGGHLALMCALSSTYASYSPVDEIDGVSCRVQWACPIYPAYVLENDAIVPEFLFDINTPPMCFVHGDADGITAMGSVRIWERLRRMGVQSDLHTLATRGHCFQFKAAPGTGSYTWLDQVWDFLQRKHVIHSDFQDKTERRGI